jgi:hypothetical protein
MSDYLMDVVETARRFIREGDGPMEAIDMAFMCVIPPCKLMHCEPTESEVLFVRQAIRNDYR